MRMKRVFCFLLIVCLCLPAFAAAEGTPALTFTLAGFDNSQYREWAENKFFARMEEKTGVHFDVTQYKDEASWTQAKAEMKALQGELGSLGNDEENTVENACIWDMLIPVIVLIVFCIIGMMYVGGFWDPEAEGYMSLSLAFGNTDASVGLPWGSIVALVVSFIYLLCRRVVTFKQATDCFVEGFKAMVPAMLILTFALTLKLATSALGADVYVAGLMQGAAAGLYSMLPAIIFLVALGLAFATGTSWGTFGILIPIVLPIFAGQPTLLTIGISACLAGAVCGDHISPISDTTVMASAGANVNHITHVSTQIPYAMTVAAISFICFILAGFVRNWVICLIVGVALIVGTLFVLRATKGKKFREQIAAIDAERTQAQA